MFTISNRSANFFYILYTPAYLIISFDDLTVYIYFITVCVCCVPYRNTTQLFHLCSLSE